MKRSTKLIIVVCLELVSAAPAFAQRKAFPLYVGRRVCLLCHTEGNSGGPCTVESMPKHDTSYEALLRPEAASIAALNGLSVKPTESRICLDCHATAADEGPRWTADTFRIEDGVQCESCHGAGSYHVEVRTHVAANQLPTHDGMARGDRARCDACHVDRPSHNEVLDYGYRLPDEDRLYKTPVNLTVSPDGERLYVVCEHSDSLIVVDPAKGRAVKEVPMGRRPHDVAISPDGRRLYVTNRLGDSLSAIDSETLEIQETVTVGHEPHAVVVEKTGRFLFVANASDDTVAVIDTSTMRVTKKLAAGAGPWSISLSSDGRRALVTNVRPNLARFRDPKFSEITVIDVEQQAVVARPKADAANMLQGIAAVPGSPVTLFTLTRTKNLIPSTRLEQGWTITNGLGLVWNDGSTDTPIPAPCDQVLLDEPNNYFPDTTDIAVSPDGRWALVTSGGANQVAVIDVAKLTALVRSHSREDRIHLLPNHLGMSSRFVVKRVDVGANPRAVVYSPDGRFAYVVNALDDSVSVLETDGYSVVRTIKLGGPTELTEIRRGEQVFHSADITYGRQFSCRSCHPDGHVNGLTFDIEADGLGMHPVDNRTLRGILDTPPFKWEGTNPSLSFQCGPRLAVFFTRLAPYKPDELAALVRYMCTIEQPRNPHRHANGLTLAQRRGKDLFERTTSNMGRPLTPEQQCAFCHSGAHKTNRTLADVGSTMWFDAPLQLEVSDFLDANQFGELGSFYFIDSGTPTVPFDVPHLRNIYNGAPYLHNGAARTLEEIWTRFNMVNRHGYTSDLSRGEYNDLIAYLKTL